MPNLVATAADGEKQPGLTQPIIRPKTVVRCLHCGQMDIVLIAPLPAPKPRYAGVICADMDYIYILSHLVKPYCIEKETPLTQFSLNQEHPAR